jgi:RNA polymerase sigma factor (sigma-70 family)
VGPLLEPALRDQILSQVSGLYDRLERYTGETTAAVHQLPASSRAGSATNAVRNRPKVFTSVSSGMLSTTLELVKVRGLAGGGGVNEQEKAAFLGFAGHVMKRLLLHHARPLYRRVEKVQFRERAETSAPTAEALQEVEDALSALACIDPKLRAVVEMRVFEGLTGDEIARQLGCSRRTISTYWNFAKRWLEKEWVRGAP